MWHIKEKQIPCEIKFKGRINNYPISADTSPASRECWGAEVSSGALPGVALQVSTFRMYMAICCERLYINNFVIHYFYHIM